MSDYGPKIAQDPPASGRNGKSGGPSNGPSSDRGPDDHASSNEIEELVRQALSQHLMRSPHFPPTLARALATDIAAAPDTNGSGGPNGSADPESACGNQGTDPTLVTLWGQVKDSSVALRALLIGRHGLPDSLADELIMHGQEGALTMLMAREVPRAETEALAEQLFNEQSLTPTLLLRSLCLGELMFFESAMATLAATSVDRVHALMYDDGPPGFFELYELARLPLGLFRAFRATMEVILQLRRDTARHWRRDFTDEIIARLVKEYEQVCPEDLEHVLSQLSRRLEETTPIAAHNVHVSV